MFRVSPLKIWVDADATPVVIKDILFRAAERIGVFMTLVANQTMRIPEQKAKTPGPVLEVHPATAARHELVDGELVILTSRQGTSSVPWVANTDLREDTLFLPYHWVECNVLIAADLDPVSKIPGFKYTPVAMAAVPAVNQSASGPASRASASDEPLAAR